jgi:membrane protease YdiL (CAAX protease family)
MRALLKRFWHDEIAPVLADIDPGVAFLLVAGTVLLINKRYLSDGGVIRPADVRWQTLCGWLLATALFQAALAKWPDNLRAKLAAGAAGAVILACALAPSGFGLGHWHLMAPWRDASPAGRGTALIMVLLVWPPQALAMAAVRPEAPRPKTAYWAMAAVLAAAALVLWGHGPLRLMLLDFRYDKLNWCFLAFCWLCPAVIQAGHGRVGPGPERDGLQLGRWRFWLPWVVVMLAVMMVLIRGFAGRQADFVAYYPMYKLDWPTYNPLRDGWAFFVCYEIAYGFYFFAWEYVFRGWLLFRLGRYYGAGAILIQTVPFVMMHLGKPGPELHSSVIAGIVLGWLAWRSRSMWPCFLIHWGAAATMDIVAMLHGLAPRPLH